MYAWGFRDFPMHPHPDWRCDHLPLLTAAVGAKHVKEAEAEYLYIDACPVSSPWIEHHCPLPN
jgi:hypothetical protein